MKCSYRLNSTLRLAHPAASPCPSNDSFGENITATTSDTAADHNAVFAINGDYYGFRDTGIVIRNGIAYRDEGARQEPRRRSPGSS